MAYKYDKYKDEILKLHHDGHSSRVIAKYLNKKYPNDNLNDSSVNKFIKRKLGTDSWHAKNQYANNLKAIEGFVHSKEHGQIARITHLF